MLPGLKNYARGLRQLMFLWLRSPDLAVPRVRQRVRSGGHDVAEQVIRREDTMQACITSGRFTSRWLMRGPYTII